MQQYASQQPAGYQNHIRKVAIVGATGRQGQHIVEELLKTGKHEVTALSRSSSTAAAKGVKVVAVDYDNEQTLVEALRGQDALIITMAVTAPKDTSLKLVEAAAKAGVPWIVPDEWGLDTTNVQLGKDVFLGPPKIAVRERIEELGVSSWIGLACMFWYEYSLSVSPAAYGFDLQKKEVTFFDDGNTKFNTSTWEQTARAVKSLLSMKILPDNGQDSTPSLDKNFRNKFAHVASFLVSQKDILESLKRVTGTTDADWKITYQPWKERTEQGQKEMKNGGRLGYVKLLYSRVLANTGEGNFEAQYEMANEILGLPKEDLDQCTKKAVAMSDEDAKGQA